MMGKRRKGKEAGSQHFPCVGNKLTIATNGSVDGFMAPPEPFFGRGNETLNLPI